MDLRCCVDQVRVLVLESMDLPAALVHLLRQDLQTRDVAVQIPLRVLDQNELLQALVRQLVDSVVHCVLVALDQLDALLLQFDCPTNQHNVR